MSQPVLTQILGTSLKYSSTPLTDQQLRQCIKDIADEGFSLSWDASPATWARHLLESPEHLAFIRRKVELLHEHRMGVSFGFRWRSLLPPEGHASFDPSWFAETLDPESGVIGPPEKPRWDVGSDAARREFAARARQFFDTVGPCDMLYVDEELFASPGEASHARTVSTYWTSPTYSTRALTAFRQYLKQKGMPDADRLGFPVTTEAVAPSPAANMGLPAVPLSEANRDRLTTDNDWPDSPLWQHWYQWREDLYAAWIDDLTRTAHDAWGHRPSWQGCMVCNPVHWFVPALGPALDKLARLPHVDILVAGYTTGHRYHPVKAAAERHGKAWGGMVELVRYGHPEGMDPQLIQSRFRTQVTAGASVMLVYAGCNFRTDRMNLPDSHAARKSGLFYLPDQVSAWRESIRWLESGRGFKHLYEPDNE